ncbi:MAG: phosphatidylglycerol lysyltransferase domain-containing protein [Actinomycetota bacterium]|nr:phosphatidylglycerol lysyltransferase domain-containing protein [Actinomycetota bacterium]
MAEPEGGCGRTGLVVRLARQLRRATRVITFTLALLLAMPLATGCLYWLRGPVAHLPGPQVAAALLLDVLAGHGGVPLVVYVLVVASIYAGVGQLARRVGLERLSAAGAMALSSGLMTFLLDALSIYIVRQVGYGQSLALASHAQPVYLNALIAGAVGAILAEQRTMRSRPAILFGWAVGLAGVMDLASAVVPRFAHQLAGLDGFAPTPAPPLENALVVPIGVVLLLTSRGLARGSRRAWRVAVVLLAASAVLHVLKGYEYEAATATGLLALALIARRRDFASRGAPGTQPRALLRLITVIAGAYVYAVAALVIDRTALGLPSRLGRICLVAAQALIGLPRRPAAYVGHGSDWFYWSVLSIVGVGAGWAAAGWLAPWRERLSPSAARRLRAERIVRSSGTDTLAPFALRGDKDLYFASSPASGDGATLEEAVVAYRVVRGVALVSGDPIGPPAVVEAAFASFARHARERGWKIAVLGASQRCLAMYRRAGLRAIYHGDEAIVSTDGFTLEGPAMRTVRQGVHRVERAGYVLEVAYAGDVPPELAAELVEVERAWLNGSRRTGFVMEMDDLFTLTGHDALFAIGRDGDRRIGGFLHAVLCPASASLSLSSLPRRAGTPNGLAAWLIVRTIEWAVQEGYGQLSLNFTPFAALLNGEVELGTLQRLEREALLGAKRRLSLQLDNLMRFNQRFLPRFEPRFVVYERRSDLPRVLVAAMAAEGYLPFADLARGRAWRSEHQAGATGAGEADEGALPEIASPRTTSADESKLLSG